MSFELLWSNLSTSSTVGVVDTRGLGLVAGDEIMAVQVYTGSSSNSNTITFTPANGFDIVGDGRRSSTSTWASIGITVFHKVVVASDIENAALTFGTASATPSYRTCYLLRKTNDRGVSRAVFHDIGSATTITHSPAGESTLLCIGAFMNSTSVVGSGTFPDGTVQRAATTSYAQAVIGSRDTAATLSWNPSFSGAGHWGALVLEYAGAALPTAGRNQVKTAGGWADIAAIPHRHRSIETAYSTNSTPGPDTYPMGVSYSEAYTDMGWPVAGTVITTKRYNAASQILVPITGTPVYTRAAAATATSWEAWQTRILTGRTWTALTLLNSWVNYGGTNHNAQFMRDDTGTVHLRGLIKSGTTTIIGSIPDTSCRPTVTLRVPVITASGSGSACQLDIRADGELRLFGTYSNTYVSLDGVRFLPE